MFVADIAASSIKRIECDPKPLISISAADMDTLMLKVKTTCVFFAAKKGLADHNLIVTIKENGI